VLLLLVAASLVLLSSRTWGSVRSQGRPVRALVVLVVIVLAVLKLTGRI